MNKVNYYEIKFPLIEYDYVVKKMIQNNVSFTNLKLVGEYYFVRIKEQEYQTLTSIDYKKVIEFARETGINLILEKIKSNLDKIIISLIIIILIYLSNLLILKVNIHSNDNNLKTLIMYNLEDYNIKNYSLKKSFNNIQKVKKQILNKYNKKIEWIEIVENGYSYDVYVIKRKQNKTISENEKCNYVAKKSGTITSINAKKGVLQVQTNNYVNAGDILISGDVIYNEELKSQICASGEIMGEVWYKVNVTYPLKKEINKLSSKNHKSISILFLGKKYNITKSKYANQKENKKIGNNFISIIINSSSKKYKKSIKYTEKQALNNSLKIAEDKVLLKLDKKSKIIGQKILKKYTNNDKMYVEVLITTEEELGIVENY